MYKKSELNSGIDLINIFINLIDFFININSGNKQLYIKHSDSYISFKSKDFKAALKKIISEDIKVEEYLNRFRTLQLIICDNARYTNTRWIKGKAVRVITVDLAKYSLLKNLHWKEN